MNKWMNANLLLLMFAGLFLATPAMNAYGHHSVVGNYDRSRTVEIKGVLVDFRIRSPHSSLTVDVRFCRIKMVWSSDGV